MVIMTSNLGSEYILDGTKSYDEMKSLVMELLRKHFRPEFLNRVDETVVFHSLTMENIEDITVLQLGLLRDRLKQAGTVLRFDDDAVRYIAQKGFDGTFGARPLRRAIQNLVETPLAREIIEGNFGEGDTVNVSAGEGGLLFK